ncbi:hypothetical protein WQ57_05195 [Mesobacillus campisalis]|uniref:Uncharacterized protein n=1 Tax=Mesobacillus campisalis TaxID=1408103 RepID=A0A0M2SYB8_9BACI|nr:hypothetical protein WQ57_05195 [Mesobacillus campisalis]
MKWREIAPTALIDAITSGKWKKITPTALIGAKHERQVEEITPTAFIGAKNKRQVQENCANGNWWSTVPLGSIDKQLTP